MTWVSGISAPGWKRSFRTFWWTGNSPWQPPIRLSPHPKSFGATNQIVKGQALEDFYARKMNATWDSRVIRGATLDAIDPEAIKYFLRKGIDKGRLR